MAELVGAFFRELIELIIRLVVEGVVKLLGWRKLLLILLAVVAVAAFYFASPGFLT